MFKWFGRSDKEKEVLSPNGNIKAIFILKSGRISYAVYKNDKIVIKQSSLGFNVCGEAALVNNFKLVRTQIKRHSETVELQWGEDHFIDNTYTEATFYLTEDKLPKRIMTFRIRVFNDAVAFRYEIPPQPKFQRISIKDELTEFKVDVNSTVWKIPAYQPDRYEYNYERASVYDLKQSVHTPLTIRTPNGCYVAIHEAALYDYGSMTIKLDVNNSLVTDITPLSDGTKAHVDLPFQTPWR